MTAVGLAHFAFPRAFEPLNRKLGFTEHTRRHVYVNGAVETAIGLTMLSPRTRTLNAALSVGYPSYLIANAIRPDADVMRR